MAQTEEAVKAADTISINPPAKEETNQIIVDPATGEESLAPAKITNMISTVDFMRFVRGAGPRVGS